MGQEVAPPRALVAAPPAGLHVQIEDAGAVAGPFRAGALTRTVVSIDAERAQPVVRALDLVVLVAFGGLVMAVLSSSAWTPVVVAGVLAFIAVVMWPARRRRLGVTRRLLTIDTETLRLATDEVMPLADVLAVEVCPRPLSADEDLSVHDVVATTPRGPLAIATTFEHEQAEHVRALVAAALSSRRRRDD